MWPLQHIRGPKVTKSGKGRGHGHHRLKHGPLPPECPILDMGTFSPFTQAIRMTPPPPLPLGFRTNLDQNFIRDIDSIMYLIHLNTEMDVYRVLVEATCRLFTASPRDNPYQWFFKLWEHATIDSLEKFVDILIKQFQFSMLYTPHIAILARNARGRPFKNI